MKAETQDAKSKLQVLIVEDSPTIARLIKAVLGTIGVSRITLAGDGGEALEKVEQATDPFGLVICDWMMPGMDGIQFLEQFRKTNQTVPFVMLTAKSTAEDFSDAKNLGATYFFMKPLDPDELLMRLEAVIETMIQQ